MINFRSDLISSDSNEEDLYINFQKLMETLSSIFPILSVLDNFQDILHNRFI